MLAFGEPRHSESDVHFGERMSLGQRKSGMTEHALSVDIQKLVRVEQDQGK